MSATPDWSDEQLIQAIANDNMEAVNEFYRRHENRVYRYALSKLGDSFAAADVLNDVMLEVWRCSAKFEGRAKVTTWLLGIAHNKIIDLWRKQGAREFTEVDENMVDESESTNPEKVNAAASDGKLLRQCMAKLKEEHREILHLIFFEELGFTEIANIMQVPEGTVKSRAFHARAQMKIQLTRAMRAA
jgi:RNA polymerase sigma factor, sigma-70 family